MDDLPFGGVGPSGMGAYHGHRGFLEFSHEKAIYRQMSSEMIAMLRPPYGDKFRKQINGQLKPSLNPIKMAARAAGSAIA